MKEKAMLFEKLPGNKVQCGLCSHRCKIAQDKFGICGVRQNLDGKLYSHVYGEAIAYNVDPIEKKPLYHFLPGTLTYSIATIGCNFKCEFCQNWQISQLSSTNSSDDFMTRNIVPKDVVSNAIANKCKSIAYTYTEPTIFFEYAYGAAKLAKSKGIANIFVTNGFMTKEALKKISPYLNAANVDLKSFQNSFYQKNCAARVAPVLENIAYMKELGIWVEVTTLLIPGQNDSKKELIQIADFLVKLDKDIPWHISRFHPQYKMKRKTPTSMESMERAYQIGKDRGLRYVYLGNVMEGNNTHCPECSYLLIERRHFDILKNNIEKGKCAQCRKKIQGRWT